MDTLKNKEPQDDSKDCTTLKKEVSELIYSQAVKDSVQDRLVNTMQEQLEQKEAVAGLQQEQYDSLKASFDKSLAQQRILELENKQYKKNIRWQRIKQKAVTTGAIILAVLVIKPLLK